MLRCLGLGGSRRNLSLYHNRTISNFVSVLDLRYLDVLVHLIVHFSDGPVSVTLVWSRIHHVIHVTQKDRIVFRYKKRVSSVSFSLNNCGLPRPLKSLSSSASSGVEIIVSDFGFLVGAVGVSILLSPPAKANIVFTSVGL